MKKLLVIDDIKSITEMIRLMLCRTFEVHTANHGHDALKMLVEQKFDAVLTDMVMPDVSGLSIIEAVQMLTQRPRVVAMTGGASDLSINELCQAAKKAGADQVIRKPFAIQDLLQALEPNIERSTP